MRPIATLAALGVLVLTLGACAAAADTVPDGAAAPTPGSVVVAAADAVSLLDERDDLVVIDVRTPAEFAEGHLVDAELINIQDPSFRDRLEDLDRDTAYLVYCRTGNRSAQAVEVMEELGFAEVYDAGGLEDLAGAGAAVAS